MTSDTANNDQPRIFKGHDLEAAILSLTQARGEDKSICPSEVARSLEKEEVNWRRLMKPIRKAATDLAQSGKIDILRHGKPIDPFDTFKGVIRLRLKPASTEATS